MTIKDALSVKKLPALSDRATMLSTLAALEYGRFAEPVGITSRVLSEKETEKGLLRRVQIGLTLKGQDYAFPLSLLWPKEGRPKAVMLYIAFNDDEPVDAMLEMGLAVCKVCYTCVSSDDADYANGLAAGLIDTPRRPDTQGKIGVWAYALCRALDYVKSLPEAEGLRCVAVGHSRLGKTALWAAANDTRFDVAYSNDSGCSGIALSRGKGGETVAAITDPERFHYWFCPAYRGFADKEAEMPFDQHWLAGCIAPRRLYACSSLEDAWAEPVSEYLGVAAVAGWEGDIPDFSAPFVRHADPAFGYHLREGGHAMTKTDWALFSQWLGD